MKPTSLLLLPSDWRADEAHIEAVAFMDEAATTATGIVNAELDRDVPSARVIDLAGRLFIRAGLAKQEVLRLRGAS
jgi:hypothetical protein